MTSKVVPDRDNIFPHSWEEFLANAVPPLNYDPPQLKLEYPSFPANGSWGDLNTYLHRSPLCSCLGRLIFCSCVPRPVYVRISAPDEWFKRMLAAEHPNCPPELRVRVPRPDTPLRCRAHTATRLIRAAGRVVDAR